MNIFFYNKWRGVEIKEVHECFTRISENDISELVAGEEVWLDLEPYYHHGKVYGYSRVTLNDITQKEERTQYSFKGSSCSGFFTRSGGACQDKPMWKLTDEDKLDTLIKQYGDKITSVHSGGW